jgi:GNAT superfamily N-acetyltransferase
MAAYLDGEHHPQRALGPRMAFVAMMGGAVVGYAAAHLTTRHGCAGEVQYLFVNPGYRRRGIGSELLRRLADWLTAQGAHRVCVPLANDSPPEAKPFLQRAGASPVQRFWYGWDNIGEAALSF